VDAGCAEVAGADSEGDFAEFKVVEELVPFLRGEIAVFFAGSQRAAACYKCPVVGDDVGWVDGGVSHRGSEVCVAEDSGRDVGWQSGPDRAKIDVDEEWMKSSDLGAGR
jgi:hypothetical protein